MFSDPFKIRVINEYYQFSVWWRSKWGNCIILILKYFLTESRIFAPHLCTSQNTLWVLLIIPKDSKYDENLTFNHLKLTSYVSEFKYHCLSIDKYYHCAVLYTQKLPVQQHTQTSKRQANNNEIPRRANSFNKTNNIKWKVRVQYRPVPFSHLCWHSCLAWEVCSPYNWQIRARRDNAIRITLR